MRHDDYRFLRQTIEKSVKMSWGIKTHAQTRYLAQSNTLALRVEVTTVGGGWVSAIAIISYPLLGAASVQEMLQMIAPRLTKRLDERWARNQRPLAETQPYAYISESFRTHIMTLICPSCGKVYIVGSSHVCRIKGGAE